MGGVAAGPVQTASYLGLQSLDHLNALAFELSVLVACGLIGGVFFWIIFRFASPNA